MGNSNSSSKCKCKKEYKEYNNKEYKEYKRNKKRFGNRSSPYSKIIIRTKTKCVIKKHICICIITKCRHYNYENVPFTCKSNIHNCICKNKSFYKRIEIKHSIIKRPAYYDMPPSSWLSPMMQGIPRHMRPHHPKLPEPVQTRKQIFIYTSELCEAQSHQCVCKIHSSKYCKAHYTCSSSSY